MSDTHPWLVAQWDNIKNGLLTPLNVGTYSHKKVWWTCEKGHSWKQSIDKRTRSTSYKGCKICSSALAVKYPYLVMEIDTDKNDLLDPYKIFCGSQKPIWWKCSFGHTWLARVTARTRKNRPTACPVCDNIKNGHVSDDLIVEWDFEKNKVDPLCIAKNSRLKAFWVCLSCGHGWGARIDSRENGQGCPKCFFKRSKESKFSKSVFAVAPHLIKEWSIKNTVDPHKVSYGSVEKFLWVCEKGHEWYESSKHRVLGGGCPYCAGKRVCEENSVYNNCPELIIEWHKKNELSCKEVSVGSAKKVWWICSFCDYEWEAVVCNRSKGIGCPKCHKNVHLKDGTVCDSLTEAYFYLKFKEDNIDFISQYKYGLGRHICDFYIPSTNTYIEVTSFDKKSQRFQKYLSTILKKEKYVVQVLKANFEFIQHSLTKEETLYVKSFVKKYNKKIGGF